MPPTPLIDLAEIDIERTLFGLAEIQAINPQRHEMAMLDRIVLFDRERKLIAGVKEVRADGFWVRGHFPGRPVFPGVLMIEAAAQLAGFYMNHVNEVQRLIGFSGVDDARFRRQVSPGDDLVLVAHEILLRDKIGRLECQGLVKGQIIFSATITGMAI